MSFGRKVARTIARTYSEIIEGGEVRKGPEGQDIHVLGSSHEEAIVYLRSIPVPPPPPGSGDSDRDDINPVQYRREMNARKRARRARRGA